MAKPITISMARWVGCW